MRSTASPRPFSPPSCVRRLDWVPAGFLGIALVLAVVGGLFGVSALPAQAGGFCGPVESSLLQTVPLFAPVDAAGLVGAATEFEQHCVGEGVTLIRQGEVGDTFYVLVRGSVEVLLETPGQPDRQLAVLEAGSFFGEIALLPDVPRTATVRTLEPSVLLTLDRQDFDDLLTSAPEVREIVERLAEQRLDERRSGQQ